MAPGRFPGHPPRPWHHPNCDCRRSEPSIRSRRRTWPPRYEPLALSPAGDTARDRTPSARTWCSIAPPPSRRLRQSPRWDDARQVGSLHRGVQRTSAHSRRRRDPPMAARQLVLAVFPDEPAADSAAAALKDSGIADGDAIGILALDAKGKLKQDKVGARSTGKGAAIGGVIAVFSTALLGPAVLAGTAVGALHHKNLGLSDADKARLTVDLNAGKAAVGVMAHSDTAPAISDRLTQLGGAPEAHELSDEAVETAATG